MESGLGTPFDLSQFWTWFLLFARFSGVFSALPGVGTEEVPITFRAPLAMLLSLVLVITGAVAPVPVTLAEGGLMIITEFGLGYVLGAVPAFIVSSLAVAGQVTAASIGLGQATLIDPSLGESVSVLARLQALMATTLFLLVDGHHAVIRAAAQISSDVGIGLFRPGVDVATVLAERFSGSFHLSVVIAGPVLVTILVTQFVLGLVTKFVPQVNIFIISMPLTIAVGLFVTEFTLTALNTQLISQFREIEEITVRLMTSR